MATLFPELEAQVGVTYLCVCLTVRLSLAYQHLLAYLYVYPTVQLYSQSLWRNTWLMTLPRSSWTKLMVAYAN